MFVKICGVTRIADARAAGAADAMGLNFVPESPRNVDLATASALVDAAPAGVRRVGVFQDHTVDEILEVVAVVGLDAVQLHGHHPPEATAVIAAHVRTLILAMTVEEVPFRSLDAHPEHVVMLDGPASGSGQMFDWSTVGDLTTNHRVLLAGGLAPDNVADAISRVRPWGVDVATGVESEPGHKDPDAVHRFVANARRANGAS